MNVTSPYKENLDWKIKESRGGLMYEIEDTEGNFVGYISMKRDAMAIVERQNEHAKTVRLLDKHTKTNRKHP